MKGGCKVFKVVGSIVVGLTLLILILDCILVYGVMHMTMSHTGQIVSLYNEDTGYMSNEFDDRWAKQMESYQLTSNLGHEIPIYYICGSKDYNNKTMILVHWHESNHKAMYPIAEVFLEQGWNVVLYDQRAHGMNTAPTVTFGYLESKDLEQVVDLVRNKTNGQLLGVLGQSMGAATIAYYSGTIHAAKNIDFAIIDSAFSSMYDEISWEVAKLKIPFPKKLFVSLGSKLYKAFYGYSFKDVDIVKQMKTNKIPTLVMHSKKDDKCPYYMGEALFNAIPHNKKVFITYEHSAHLFSFWDEKARYVQEINTFVENISTYSE